MEKLIKNSLTITSVVLFVTVIALALSVSNLNGKVTTLTQQQSVEDLKENVDSLLRFSVKVDSIYIPNIDNTFRIYRNIDFWFESTLTKMDSATLFTERDRITKLLNQ
jgi:hypothetical protein